MSEVGGQGAEGCGIERVLAVLGHVCRKGTMHFRGLLSPRLLTLQAPGVHAN